MALQLGALRDALLDAGAKPELANKASEEAASYESRLASIETKLAVLMVMVSGVAAGVASLVWKAFVVPGVAS
jgi:phage shock protein A